MILSCVVNNIKFDDIHFWVTMFNTKLKEDASMKIKPSQNLWAGDYSDAN